MVFIDGKSDQKRPRRGVFPTHAVKTILIRLRGWAPQGERLTMDAPFGSWGTNPGLRPFGAELIHWINSRTPLTPDRRADMRCAYRTMGHQRGDASRDIHCAHALLVIDGPAFAAYIREVLVTGIAPGTVVILDNLATHRNKEAAKALREHGCWFLYLPPYSPDLNPSEQAFSKLKAHLRRIGTRSFTSVFEAIGQICERYDPTECWNYFKAAGYVSN